MSLQASFFGYIAAAAGFAGLFLLSVTLWRERLRGIGLPAACLVSFVWAALLAWSGSQTDVPVSRILIAEMTFDAAWLVFLSSLLSGAVAAKSNWLVRRGGVVLGLALLGAALLLEFAGLKSRFPEAMGQLLVMGSIATSLYALVGLEQIYRNARPAQQNGLKFLGLGLAGIFAYDIFLYSSAVIEGLIRPMFWVARGFVVALCIPLIGISVRRVTAWTGGIFASREVVFYTTTLFAAGIYLSLVGLAGYYIRSLGRGWGDVLLPVFVFSAVIAFFLLLLSEQLRARIRVFVTKHFFERKYDYRAEWLRLIDTLTSDADGLPLKKRAIRALAQIVEAPSGHLWLRDGNQFSSVTSWDTQPLTATVPRDAPLAEFLQTNGWIVDLAEVADNHKRYAPLKSADIPEAIAGSAFIIPLLHDASLLGFVTLTKPRTPIALNFEDYDLLKTAGQQVASYLAQAQSTEKLAESRQFEAYNRFTAFVMHDLKNAIAQQSLVVENAERHKRNPEFVDDAMQTIKGSVTRMRRVLQHLRQEAVDQPDERVDLSKVVAQVESQCADREPAPIARGIEKSVVVRANRERLLAALSHAVRNAQDACTPEGDVRIDLDVNDKECILRIADTGCGMDQDFVKNRLFRPFDSTKGAEGMGIGAYQIRETVRASGGELDVDSRSGEGTTLTIRLPLAVETL